MARTAPKRDASAFNYRMHVELKSCGTFMIRFAYIIKAPHLFNPVIAGRYNSPIIFKQAGIAMVYLQYVSKEEKRRYGSSLTLRLFAIYFLISVATNSYISDEFRYGIGILILVIAIVLNKINVILETTEIANFEVSSRDGNLVFKRFGKCVFEVESSRIASVWYVPSKYFRNRLFIELDNHQKHSFRLPLIVNKKINEIDAHSSGLKGGGCI